MDANDFRELALGFDDAEESAHMGAADFRVGGRIFATLAHEALGFGNLMLSPELQQSLIAESPDVFLPVSGGWGRQGATHIRLAEATRQQLLKGLRLAWTLRVEKNGKAKKPRKKASLNEIPPA
ncbi:MmcQ/YjbR family DNA-binding protein [Singulisphaera sp. PoT]|uniref:MmcQ/YjbR family DNA-binding protein n=1 Tax=Singulisphaera sp. PoT TaxID=3411797 RepID=UPI003BF4EB6F